MSSFFTIDTWQCRWPFQKRILYDIQRTGTPDNPGLRCDVVGARGENLICVVGSQPPHPHPLPLPGARGFRGAVLSPRGLRAATFSCTSFATSSTLEVGGGCFAALIMGVSLLREGCLVASLQGYTPFEFQQ